MSTFADERYFFGKPCNTCCLCADRPSNLQTLLLLGHLGAGQHDGLAARDQGGGAHLRHHSLILQPQKQLRWYKV